MPIGIGRDLKGLGRKQTLMNDTLTVKKEVHTDMQEYVSLTQSYLLQSKLPEPEKDGLHLLLRQAHSITNGKAGNMNAMSEAQAAFLCAWVKDKIREPERILHCVKENLKDIVTAVIAEMPAPTVNTTTNINPTSPIDALSPRWRVIYIFRWPITLLLAVLLTISPYFPQVLEFAKSHM